MWDRAMRALDVRTEALFSCVSCEARVPGDHPLRPIRAIVAEALVRLSPELGRGYARMGRPSIAPEKLLRALLTPATGTAEREAALVGSAARLAATAPPSAPTRPTTWRASSPSCGA
jgi:hypothetical protein